MKIVKIKKGEIEISKKVETHNIYLYRNEKVLIPFYKQIKKNILLLDLEGISEKSFDKKEKYNWEKIKDTNLVVIWVFSMRNLLLIEKGLDFMDINMIKET